MREAVAIKQQRVNISIISVILFAFWLMAFSLFSPARAASSAKNALAVCAAAVVPSLLVFLVCAKIIIKTDFCSVLAGSPLRRLCPVFGVSPGGLLAILIGFISGFPMGAVALSDLCREGKISREEASSLLPFCNNAGPAFVVGTVGSSFFGSAKLGAVLLCAQTAASFLGILLTKKMRQGTVQDEETKKADTPPVKVLPVISASIAEGALTLLSICGFVVFFCVLSDSLVYTLDVLTGIISEEGKALLRGFFEISGGFASLAECGGLPEPAVLVISGAMLGFGGISVCMQVADRVQNAMLPMNTYFSGKLLCAVLCAGFAVLFGMAKSDIRTALLGCGALLCGVLFYQIGTLGKKKCFSKKFKKIKSKIK